MADMKRVTPPLARAILREAMADGNIPAGFDLRLATLADITALLTAGRECFSYNPPTRRELRHAIAVGHAMVVMLMDKKSGRLAGFDIYEFNARNQCLYLNLSCLLPEWRGRGLSRVLLDLCHRTARRAGCRSIRSHVAAGNAAMIHLLEKYGHQKGESHKNYYSDKKTAYTYRLFLSAEAA
jgi:ribosomal protein S18 acetylase RimI-like enzyme